MFDETHYARDACTYVSSDGCGISGEENHEHPPFGKMLIAVGVMSFGNEAFGWRIASALAGIISVLLLYLLALRLGGSRVVALLSAGLMALDPLHLVQSRVAMLDIFVAMLGLVALLCALNARSASRRGARLWLLGLGLSGGAATATKWSGAIFLLLGLAILVFDRFVVEPRPDSGANGAGTTSTTRGAFAERATAISVAAAAGVVGVALLVYALTYVGRLDGPWLAAFFERHADMWSFHSGLDYTHPYASTPWSWLVLQRPVAYLYATASGGRVAEVLATGNPLLWWPALVALGAGTLAWARGRATTLTRGAVVGFAATFGIWLLFSPFRSAMFLFYMTPVLPFMYLALAESVARWRWAAGLAAGAAVISLLFFWPVLTGQPIDRDGWHRRMLFEDCRGPGRTAEEVATPLIRATPGGGPAPEGWCWI
jgi:dolichyl-phosphate-mannose--protein O-mannosyl transferase